MTNNHHTLHRRILLAVPAAAVAAALAATPSVAATPVTVQPGPVSTVPGPTVSPPTQGIIMRDGGVCDPIRHMGC
jgi:hypothetical protein